MFILTTSEKGQIYSNPKVGSKPFAIPFFVKKVKIRENIPKMMILVFLLMYDSVYAPKPGMKGKV